MKLEILVPHYHEKADVVKPLLDSIALQQNVDFNEIGVIICHDGKDPQYSIYRKEPKEDESPEFEFYDDYAIGGDYSLFGEYPFKIKQIRQEHKGVSAARNACLDASTAEYVMFCDIDDMFFNSCGLWILFREMKEGFDSLVSVFLEETRDPSTGDVIYINHEMDGTFVHGKVHRRKYLITNKIRFDDNLTIHEDSYFNILCQSLSDQVKYCVTPFYLWKWRDESVCRHDPKYILKTFNNMLDSNDALIDQFLKRGMRDKAAFYVGVMIFNSYYTMNKPEWINVENAEYRNNVDKRFSQYYNKYRILWDSIPDADKMQISNGTRSRIVMEGMQMETITISEWLKKMESIK